MKLMRWAMCVAAFALVGGIAISEDWVDVQALQAKLAAQEARLNDLHAKMYGNACEDPSVIADGLTSLRKNAVVTIGGTINTRYDFYKAKIDSSFDTVTVAGRDRPGWNNAPGNYTKRRTNDVRYGKLGIADVKFETKIDVNDYFDAYMKFDLQDDRGRGIHSAQNAWIRWKNVCNSGFGLLVGRDSLKFGGTQPYGRYDSWNKGMGDMAGNVWGDFWGNGMHQFTGMAIGSGMPVRAAVWDDSRTTQITPYWESQDGAFKAEVSFFQEVQYANGDGYYDNDWTTYQRKANDGWGSFSARLTWKPIDGLTIRGSVLNLYAKHREGNFWGYPAGTDWGSDNMLIGGQPAAVGRLRTSKNNFAANIGFEYRPCFFNKLNLFATWTHSWNDAWIKDQDSDSISFGLGFDILDNLTLYTVNDYVRAKSDQAKRYVGFGNDAAWNIHKAAGWAHEVGLKYTFPYGVWIDAGYRHERMKYKNAQGVNHTKLRAHTFYTTLGFDF